MLATFRLPNCLALLFTCAIGLGGTILFPARGADAPGVDEAGRSALTKLQPYIGQWRGVGQIRRGSNDGAWTEQTQWIWQFGEKTAAFVFQSPQGKYFASGELRPVGDGSYRLDAVTSENASVAYAGQLDVDRLVLSVVEQDDALPARITIRQVAGGDRMLILYERKSPASDRLVRMAEVGYTRVGSNFGKGATGIECVVTGGKGTMPVTHQGRTYYVCCTGCRDLFNEDPEGVLAEYRERKAAERRGGSVE